MEHSAETPIVKAIAKVKVKIIRGWPIAGNEGISHIVFVGLLKTMLSETSACVQAHLAIFMWNVINQSILLKS